MSSLRIGLDLGGTKMLAAVLAPDGTILGRQKRPTKAEKGYAQVVKRLLKTIRGACDAAGVSLEKDIAAVGVGAPGPIDVEHGRVLAAANLGWSEKPLAADLSGLVHGKPVTLGNDVNCGALGEVRYGCGTGVDSAFAVFMGTGLGGALIIDGRVVNGVHGFAGEFGHIPGPFDNALCSCGQRGCLETLASKRGLERLLQAARDRGESALVPEGRLKSRHLRQAWDENCVVCKAALQQSAQALGWGLGLVMAVADPALFILGGGVLEELGHELEPFIRQGMAQYTFFQSHTEPRFAHAELAGDAVAVGAAELVKEFV